MIKKKNEENWEKDIKKSIHITRDERGQKEKTTKNVSVPSGHGSSKFAVPGSKKACQGHAGTV